MKGKEVIKQLLSDFHTRQLPLVRPREYAVPLNSGKIVTLIGVRRSGKTFLLYQLIHELLKTTGIERIIFIDFEDERLELQSGELDWIIQAYLELYPEIEDLSSCYFFFDEIQNIEGWEKFIRRIYERWSRHIFITGSNAKMLSSEIATALRGRSISYTVYPLSFMEFLLFQDIAIEQHATIGRARIQSELDRYLYQGGFPELLSVADEELHRIILQEYYQVMLFRDLIDRYQISNTTALKFFLKRLFASATKQISINRLYNELKSSGIRVSKNTLYTFLDEAEAIFLFGVLKKQSHKVSTREFGEKKIYAVDNGLHNAVHFRFSSDIGKAMEQTVYWELRRRYPDSDALHYFRKGVECDFIIQQHETVTNAVQVCYDLTDPDTKKREIEGLYQACIAHSLKKGLLISRDHNETIRHQKIQIEILPLAEYLLDRKGEI